MRTLFRQLILKRIERHTKLLIQTHQPVIIGVTGSVGKTSTKLAIAHLLSESYEVNVHEGNYNTDFGLPLSMFNLDPPEQSTDIAAWWKILRTMKQTIKNGYPYDVLVLELGADKPRDIQRFMRYLEPDIGVVTAVAKVHYEAFDSIEQILDEKWSLAEGSKKVVYNHDDKRLRTRAESVAGAVGYGLDKTDVYAVLNEFDANTGWRGELRQGESKVNEVTFPVVGQQSVYGLTAAAAVARELKLDWPQCLARLATWEQPAGRMHLLQGKNDISIIDDTYNASPYSTVAALDALYRLPGRKVAILGSMNELGDYEVEGHKMVGRQCGDLDILVTIGVAANTHLAQAALVAGLDPDGLHECNTPYEAASYLEACVQSGDVVLAKGSQTGVYAEEAIKPLLANQEDSTKLVRQSEAWLRQKQEEFNT